MNKKYWMSALILSAFSLVACSKKDNASTADTQNTAAQSAPAEQQNIQLNNATAEKPVEPTAEHSVAPSTTYIETKLGDKNSTVHLSKVRVVGQVLSVDLVVEPERSKGNPEYFNSLDLTIPLDQVSYIDDSTSKKFGLLKDDSGAWMMSGNVSSSDGNKLTKITTSPFPLNFKFPAPSAEAKTVSITITNLASFDGVPISR